MNAVAPTMLVAGMLLLGVAVEKDDLMRMILEAETPVVTIVGKTWLLHVTEVLRAKPEEPREVVQPRPADFLQVRRLERNRKGPEPRRGGARREREPRHREG